MICLFFLLIGSKITAQQIMYTIDNLILREQPSVNSRRIRTLPVNTRVIILEISNTDSTIGGITNKWYKVLAGNEIGWVFGGYLSDNSNVEKIIGFWWSGYRCYAFDSNGAFITFVYESGFGRDGKWRIVNNKLFLSGVSEGDDGFEEPFSEELTFEFIDNNNLKLYSSFDGKPNVYVRKNSTYRPF
jgi:hypothetical protein